MSIISNHPKGLYVCFMTEMWERFSYYGMKALLILYLTKHFLFTDDQSFEIYGAYISLVYAVPVIGGLIADRYLGSRKAVTLGAILLVMGHFGMAFEGAGAARVMAPDGIKTVARDPIYLQIFYFSLALIIIGVGFLKPNISTIVGKLYTDDDPRRDSGFTIFYMGINLGGAIAATLCGYLGETYGWAYGFGLAGIGMLFGLIVFQRGQPLLEGHAEPPADSRLQDKMPGGLTREILIYLGAAAGVLVAWQLVQQPAVSGSILTIFGIGISLAVIAYSILKCTPVERDRMLVAIVLIFFSIVFWAFFEQAGSSINLFTDRSVNRDVMGVIIPASMFQSVNSIFIILLALPFAGLWVWLAKRRREPSTPVKFALGMLQMSISFGAMVYGASLVGADGKVGLVWLLLGYLFQTTGELCLSPVGLSMITKLSVKRVVGMMMGVWFLSNAAAGFVSSIIAKGSSVQTANGEAADPILALHAYASLFEYIFWVALGVGIFMLLISPLLERGMHGVH